jgi:hypothetical protein
MARQWQSARRRAQPGGTLLTCAVVLLAVAACVLISPPTAQEVAAVFAPGGQVQPEGVTAVSLPARNWYLVEAGGKAVAACGALIEAEILRDASEPLAEVRRVQTEEIALRVTAAANQAQAMRESADALMETFRSLEQMAYLPEAEAKKAAQDAVVRLSGVTLAAEQALSGVENPVVRGLTGLVGSCHSVMTDLSLTATADAVQRGHALLVQQYEAFYEYLSELSAG